MTTVDQGPRAKVVAGTNRMFRKRKALFTDAEIADRCGCSEEDIVALESSFWTPLQRRYALSIGYLLAAYPRRKRTYIEDE